jgi:hypothetical protein
MPCLNALTGCKSRLVWLSLRGTTAQKQTHAAKNEKEFTSGLLPSASGELLPNHGSRITGKVPLADSTPVCAVYRTRAELPAHVYSSARTRIR